MNKRFLVKFLIVILGVVTMGAGIFDDKKAMAYCENPNKGLCNKYLKYGLPSHSSVLWAAERAVPGTGAYCALWLAEPNDYRKFTHVVTEAEYKKGTLNLKIYGMCVQSGPYPGQNARDIYVTGDGGSISPIPTTMVRYVGLPPAASTGTTLSISKFLKGLTGKDVGGGYKEYSREILIHRCNAATPSSCSNDRSLVVLRVKDKEILDPDCAAWAPKEYVNSDEDKGDTKVQIGVKNYSLEGFTESGAWHHEGAQTNNLSAGPIYAKPTDEVQWKHCYYPGVERVAGRTEKGQESRYKAWAENLKPENKAKNVQEALNGYVGGVAMGEDEVLVGTLPGGKVEKAGLNLRVNNRLYNVQPWDQATLNRGDFSNRLDPGGTLWGRIKAESGWTHAERAGTWRDSGANPQQDNAKVIVPYNYRNTGKAEIEVTTPGNPNDDVLFSGETAWVKTPQVTVGKRNNALTDGNLAGSGGYATQVDGGQVRLVAFLAESDQNLYSQGEVRVDDFANEIPAGTEGSLYKSSGEACGAYKAKNGVCKYLEEYNDRLNENSNMTGETYDVAEGRHYESGSAPTGSRKQYNVFDEAAGNYFCVSMAVYPFSTAGDADLSREGDRTWFVSKPSCKLIAKRPTFQVWGAGVYAVNDVKTSVSMKNNVLDAVGIWDRSNYGSMNSVWGLNWGPTGGTNTLFGSFGELSLVVGGKADRMASGAATGYLGGLINEGSSWSKQGDSPVVGIGNSGGAQGSAVNDFCLRSPLSLANVNCSSAVGGFAAEEVRNGMIADAQALVGRFPDVRNDQYERRDTNTVGDTTVGDKSIINITEGDVTINDNIVRERTTGLSRMQDVKEYILRTTGDINISCEVTRLDAVMITTEGKVDTCYQSGESNDANAVNSRERRRQLVVNGAIVAGSVDLKRSYGAGTGEHSMTPAELVNYDTSLYLWANALAEGSVSGRFTEVATRELAPRY